MKKVININFQGRVIPIEEAAYDELKQYVDSLRTFFANEEGRDEIINDIEGRIAELFGERLKKGSTCITNEDVESIIASMGRPEDFEDEENNMKSQFGGNQEQSYRPNFENYTAPAGKGRLYRDTNDKVLGGVCSGLAAYFRIDPSIIRIIFVVFTFSGGAGFLLYLLMWIILPSKPLDHIASTKRLYRNPEEKVIAGVASGIATYFDIAIWVPRLIFAMPLVLGILSSIIGSAFWFDAHPFPSFVFSSFGGSLFIIYAVLWAVIPEANSASEKLEMRGEKVDLNTIKNTIQEDLEGFKQRAEKWGGEFSEKAKAFGSEFSQTAKQKGRSFGNEASYVAKSSGSKIGGAIAILFKAFFLFIAGIIAFALLIALLAMLIGSVSVFPLKDFLLSGFWQNCLAWSTLLLFLFVPVVGLVIWLIRKIIGAKAGSKYLGFTFGGLWTLGWVSVVCLAASISQDFDARARDKKDIAIVQPSNQKMIVKVEDAKVQVIGKWLKLDGIISMDNDSLVLNNINLRIAKSSDSLYHISYHKYSNGPDEETALRNIEQINYGIVQADSMIYLNRGFNLKKDTKFRNQGVVVTIQVPVGKKIEIDRNVSRRLNWFNINHNNNDYEWEDDWNGADSRGYSSNVEYIMTPGGLERTKKEADDEFDNNEENSAEKNTVEDFKKSKEELKKEYERKIKEAEDLKKELDKPFDSARYRYQKAYYKTPNSAKPNLADKVKENRDTYDLGSEGSRISLLYLQS
jgi:phage shock protein PspC (stress-responsive transcriptional regulator)